MTAHSLRRFCAFAFLAICAFLLQPVAGFGNPVLPAPPPIQPFSPLVSDEVNVDPPFQSYAEVVLHNVPNGYTLVNGAPYLGWCADSHQNIFPTNHPEWGGQPYYPIFYDSRDAAALPVGFDRNFTTLADFQAKLNKVNYILNHKPPGANKTDIQLAIWDILNGGGSSETDLRDMSWRTTFGFPEPTGAEIPIVNAANANGATFVPVASQFLGVVLDHPAGINTDGPGGPPTRFQPFFIEVLCPPDQTTPGFEVMKRVVGPTTISAGDPVTYEYTVKNTGLTTLTDIELIDDNSTPNVPGDDFIVVTGLTLAPGTQQSFTLTKFVPLTVCIPVNNVPTVSGTLIVQQLPNLDWQVIFRQSLNIVDNTYGANASPDWKNGHTFGNFTGSDKAQFIFKNGAGTTVLDATIDYISASAAYPSGYGSLGATGGDGSVKVGSAASLASFTTTMTTNLNQSPAFHGFIVDSPAPPANFPTWDYVDGYTVVVKNSAFGPSGFGSVTLGEVHNSPPKTGSGGNIPTPCESDAKNIAKGTAKFGSTTLTAQADATVHIIGPSSGGSTQAFTTYKRDDKGWDGATAGALLTTHFPTLYPAGLIVGGTKTLTFGSAAAVRTFLPSSGSPKALNASAINPTTSNAGELAGNTIALKLNVDFSNAGILKPGLASLKLKNGKFGGKTVAQVLAIANSVLGGAAPPAGTSIGDVNNAAKTINENFDKGTANKGDLIP